MFAVRTLVHGSVERLVDRLVLGLVANTGLPAPGLAVGVGAPVDQSPEAPRVRLLVRPILALPVNEDKRLSRFLFFCGLVEVEGSRVEGKAALNLEKLLRL